MGTVSTVLDTSALALCNFNETSPYFETVLTSHIWSKKSGKMSTYNRLTALLPVKVSCRNSKTGHGKQLPNIEF